MAKVIGVGGVFFKSQDPKKLGEWYRKWLEVPVESPYGANFKPVEVPEGILGEGRRFVFVSPRSGYTNIYAASLDGMEKDVEILLEGEREALLEALHPFQSKLDVSADGILVFVSVWHERDALLITFDYGDFVERHRILVLADEDYRAAIADAGMRAERVEGTPRYWLGRARA